MSNIAKPPFPRLNRRHPTAQGLVFDAVLAEGSGNKTTETVNGTEGSFVASGATWQSHNYGFNALFSAAASSINFTTRSSANGLGVLSVEMMVNRAGTGGGNYGRVFTKGAGTVGTYWFRHNNDFPGALSFESGRTTTAGGWRIGTTATTTNTWYHAVVTYDGSSVTNDPVIYVNGAAMPIIEFSTPVGTLTADDTNLYIGNTSVGTRNWAGKVGHLRIWNRILSADEAKALSRDSFQVYLKRKPKLVR